MVQIPQMESVLISAPGDFQHRAEMVQRLSSMSPERLDYPIILSTSRPDGIPSGPIGHEGTSAPLILSLQHLARLISERYGRMIGAGLTYR